MKKRLTTLILLLLIASLVTLAGCNLLENVKNAALGTTNTPTQATTEKPTESTPAPGSSQTPNEPDEPSNPSTPNDPTPAPKHTVSVINGTIGTSSTSGSYITGTSINLRAAESAKGFSFSHWENAAGEQVSTERSFRVTVSKNETYKAYYKAVFGSNQNKKVILSDLQNDWQQGGVEGKFTAFKVGDEAYSHRVSFAEPFFLKAGETLTVSVPKDTWICPHETDDKDDTVACDGGCTITVARLILKKNAGSETGDLFTDYTLQGKGTWNASGFSYVATSDVYVMITVKYDKHGSTAFTVDKPIMQELVVTHATPKENPIGDSFIGDYWEDEVNDAIEKIEANRESIGTGVSEFFFITDVHWKDYNVKYSPALINMLAERLDEYHVVFGGDVIELNDTREGAINDEILPFYNTLSQYTKAGEQLKILTTIGNHDRNILSHNIPQSSTVLSDADVYNIYVRRTEDWAVMPQGNPYCSYYDDTENKVRYLQFAYASNTVDLAGEKFEHALQWSEAQITSLDSDWTVVLFSHGIFGGTQNEALDAVKDRVLSWQAKADAEIAIWITGHTHRDINEIFVSKDGTSAIRAISLNCDSSEKKSSGTADMDFNTATEQSFSFIQIDKANQMIYLTRIGAGDDLTFTYGTAMEGEYEAVPQYAIRVVNGTVNGLFYTRCPEGTELTLTANQAPAGYEFSCWKDSKGNIIGYTKTLTVAASESTQYKPYYVDIDSSNDSTNPNQVKTDLANDWMPGGLSAMPDAAWWTDSESLRDTRTCFAEPLLLKKGQTITVNLPQITCPTGECKNGCKLMSLIAAMDKAGESDTNDLPSEYTVYYSKWTATYTATKDTYVIVMIKYDKHGNINFTNQNEEMQGVVITVTP